MKSVRTLDSDTATEKRMPPRDSMKVAFMLDTGHSLK